MATAYGQPPMQPMVPMSARRMGAVITMFSNVLGGIGVIILAFSLGRITVSNVIPMGTYPSYGVSFAVEAGPFMFGTLLIGVGIILRGIGGLMSTSAT